MVQQLSHCASNAVGAVLILGQRTKIPHAAQCSKKITLNPHTLKSDVSNVCVLSV